MVKMSAIWDRAAEVLRGRGGMMAGIAALLLFVPAVVQNGLGAYAGTGAGAAGLGALVGLAVFAINLWGNLSLVAAASDPAVDRPAALGIAGRRLPLAIGLSLLVLLLFFVLSIPPILMVASRVGLAALASSGTVRVTPPQGLVVAVLAYFMVLAAFGLWLTARLALFAPVLVNERRGIGSFARSFELTRGLGWQIVGVIVLFGVLLLVAVSAAQAVTAIVARLLLGATPATGRFAASVAVAAVVAGATVVSSAFLAQLYRVVSGREAARTFG